MILKKIINNGATRCQILRPECKKIDFGWGSAPSAPGPAGGPYTYSAPPQHLAGLRGPTSKGRTGFGRRGWEGERGRAKG